MRADRVKPGHIVKDDEGVWQVVVDRRGPACLVYANGHEEWGAPDAGVEAVRLTDAQIKALRIAEKGALARWPPTFKNGALWLAGTRQAGRSAPFERLRELGLIETARTTETGMGPREDFEVTPSGRALLDVLDKEKAR